MPTESFDFNDNREFYLIPDVAVEGISDRTLKYFCNDLLFSGNCYNALSKLCTPTWDTRTYKYEGIIFKEFCESIERYLQFFRVAVFTIPDTLNYTQFDEETRHLQTQISVLASVCKVGPYMSSEDVPNGIDLLNYLYLKILDVMDQKVLAALFSILFPCCQVYFR